MSCSVAISKSTSTSKTVAVTLSVVVALYATTAPLGQSLASTLTNEPSPVPAPAPAPTTKHTAVEQDQTALFQTTAWKKTSVDDAATSATALKSNFVALPPPRHRRDAGRESQLWGSSQILPSSYGWSETGAGPVVTKGTVYFTITGHDKTEHINVDVERPLDDVRDALDAFTQFPFDGNFRLKNKHDVLDSSKTLRELGLQNCGAGDYLELEYSHRNYFPGLRGGVSKRTMASAIAASGVDDRFPSILEKLERDVLEPLYQLAQAELAKAEALGQTVQTFPGKKVMASAILRSGIDRPPGKLDTMDRATILEPLYLKAQAVLAKAEARPRRVATTEQSETKEEEDVEMEEVTQITLGDAKDEKRLKAEVEKLLGKALEAWTCAKSNYTTPSPTSTPSTQRLLARWRGGVGLSPFERLSWHGRVVAEALDSLG